MSKLPVAIVVLIVGAVAVIAYRKYQPAPVSPFAVGTVHPGMRFSDVEDDAQRETKHRYRCQAAGGGVQVCELLTIVPAGLRRQVVDSSGHVAISQFLIVDDGVATHDLGRRQMDEWNRVRPGETRPSDETDLNWESWRTVDSLWTAEVTWRRSADAPARLMATDERRLWRMAESNPAVLQRLVEDTLLDSHDRAKAASVAPGN
jgi:hypothetical protein